MKKVFIIIISFIIVFITNAQEKKKLSFDDIIEWNRITEKIISNNGDIIVYKVEPWKGNSALNIVDKSGELLLNTECGFDAMITNDSKYVVFSIEPKKETIKELKLKHTEKDKMPLNKLGIYNVSSHSLDTISNLISTKVPKKWNGWIAYQKKSTELADSTNKESKKNSDKNGHNLIIRNLYNNQELIFPFVTEYVFAKEKQVISFISTGNDEDFKAGVYLFNLNDSKQTDIFVDSVEIKQLSIDQFGSKVAFLADLNDNNKTDFNLFLWNEKGLAQEIVNSTTKEMPLNWEVSVNSELNFSKTKDRLFFGIAPIKPEKDTTILDEEIPKLDIWHWNEPILHSQQINTKEQDLKKAYLAVYHINNKKMVQLEKEYFTGVELINEGDNDKMLAWSNLPYSVQSMWEGEPEHFDFYLVDLVSGTSEIIKKDCRAYPEISPGGNYIYWYNYTDTTWNTYNISDGIEFKVTDPKIIQCADEINDVPNLPDDYGIAGWSKKDEALLVYDRYDIWKVDPENKNNPINLTKTGRKNKINYRIIDFENYNRRLINDEKIGLDLQLPIYLKAHNEITRVDAYDKLELNKSIKVLTQGKFQLNPPIKAKDKDVFLYTRETFQEFPDLLVSENEFKKSKKISNVNPQQSEFLWGTKELYSWTSLDGQKLEGLLIKPANFDPNKKYPMIVNFYEKSSQGLYSHQIPEAHRSTVDYHYYSSNGYIIFNPDVYYKEGYPGESAYNCVMPGVTQLINEGFVDENAIAAQGHSWGGYQVAYLATRTNLFAAIESGAPVVNMFSAYGGIRLWSGRNRSFQYEHTQSRIGKSIWESPLRYLENSPLFTADKIQTPMLIMHNENDGAVPFSQGIEFFIALRRMGKTAWLLNYNEADHWPTIVRDKYDFQIRLAQFFDHYLKGEPMPKWMKEGIPVVDKEFEMGYEIIE